MTPGRQFNRLTVINRNGTIRHGTSTVAAYLCECQCGTRVTVDGGKLRSGHTKSCGCLKADKNRVRLSTHGATHTPEYKSWASMKRRCQSDPRYVREGIYVCPQWIDSFETFLNDMGPKPSPTHSIDRLDNSDHYHPENCRWADKHTQALNRRPYARPWLRNKRRVTQAVLEHLARARAKRWGH